MFLWSLGFGFWSFAATPAKPNFLYILCDDLGYGDVKCLNPKGKIATPQLDKLAAAGMIFTDVHSSSAVCTPTRYGIMTGRYNWRTRLQSGVLGGLSPRLIEPGRLTVAQLLKDHGYHTACIGKWGLGGPGSSGEPNRMGFDHYYGYLCQRIAHNHYPSYLWRNREKVPLKNEYVYPHEKLPAELVQSASAEQPPLLVRHSLMSLQVTPLPL